MNNLIRSEAHQQIARELNEAIFAWLEKTKGMQMPLRKDQGKRFDNKFSDTY
jgi:hypothetical protein